MYIIINEVTTKYFSLILFHITIDLYDANYRRTY